MAEVHPVRGRDVKMPANHTRYPHVRTPRPRFLRRTARQDRHPADQVRAHGRSGQARQRPQRTVGAGSHLDGAPGRGEVAALRAKLKAVNERLWAIEDDIRIKEKAQAFDDEFIRLARSVYVENDVRARIKKDINLALGSTYVEEKSYEDYGSGATP